MTRVKILTKNGNILGVDCFGHTGFAEEGEDIVCAALSSVVQTALLGLLNVAAVNVKITRNDDLGILKFDLPQSLSETEMHDSQVILKTMLAGVSDLSENWSKYIKLEVK